jgi:protocatechuate 3,4-dioxygenase beta subunit
MRVHDGGCNPVANASVDIWACDAEGNYAGYTASPDEFATSGSHVTPETDERFCRGVLATDPDGIAEFDTIFPGYYAGRAIHIHFKVHVGDKAFVTNQALMPEAVNENVLLQPPYNLQRGTTRVLNAEEGDDFAIYKVEERGGRLLALLNVGIST